MLRRFHRAGAAVDFRRPRILTDARVRAICEIVATRAADLGGLAWALDLQKTTAVGSSGSERGELGGALLDDAYRLLREVGRGAFGCVYEAEQLTTGARFAVKVLHAGTTSPRSRQRFAHEASVLARLEHDNIVKFIRASEDGAEKQYLVLELVNGKTLRTLLPALRAEPADRVLDIVRQVGQGLAHAHGAGIVHRDLKPENIMLAESKSGEHRVKILDFGIARLFEAQQAPITSSGAVLGTASYMAPEQARGERDIDHRVDVYALGVILYEALSGRRPFDGASYNETLFRIQTKPHVPLEVHRPDLPRGLCAAVDRSLAKERTDRFLRVEDFLAALEQPGSGDGLPTADFGTTDSSGMSVAGTRERVADAPPRRRALTLLALAGGGLLGIAIGFPLGSSTAPTPARLATQPSGMSERLAAVASRAPQRMDAGALPAPPLRESAALPAPSISAAAIKASRPAPRRNPEKQRAPDNPVKDRGF